MKKFIIPLILLILVFGCSPKSEQENILSWIESEEGISHIELTVNYPEEVEKSLVLVKINPAKFNFKIYENPADKPKTIKEIHSESESILTFNGGFFTEDFKPTGLLISEGKKLADFAQADLIDGIFVIKKDGKVSLMIDSKNLKEKDFNFAIQNGPVLIDQKGVVKIKSDTGKLASRTAIGIDKNGEVIVIVLKPSLLRSDNIISLFEFANLLKNTEELKDLNLHSVLNLDGGVSTGMMIDQKYYPEMERVQNVVMVSKK